MASPPSGLAGSPSLSRLLADLPLVAAAWLLSIGIDFLLHGGLLARLYLRPEPFLLPPGSAFARIPLGYLSFLILSVGLWWLLCTGRIRGGREGLRLGLLAGAVTWGGFLLGLFSISTAPPGLLVGWWAGQSVELGAAGAVMGAGFAATSRRPIYLCIAGLLFLCVVVTVALQSVGWAPPMEAVSR